MSRAASMLLFTVLCLASMNVHPATPAPTAEQTSSPSAPSWLDELDALYDARVRVAGLEERTFTAEHWWNVATPLTTEAAGFSTEVVGQSAEGRPLQHISWGEGTRRVLLWSQMHGDESTASMSLADLFRFLGEHPDHPLVRRLRAQTSLHFLPIVNPDGAARFQRRNAQGIDINRDARALASPEARILHALRERLKPGFGFNLHDQDVGTRVGDSERGTAMALLAPPYNAASEIDASRTRAIEVCVAIRAVLEPYIGDRLARWDDSFNPRAFGDLTAQAGVSTILIESGGIEGDLHKQQLRKLNFLALVGALDAIATGAHAGLPLAAYQALPENGDSWPDLLVRGGTLVVPGQAPITTDLVVDFRDGLLERDGMIVDVGDLVGTRTRRTIDAAGLYVVPVVSPGSTPETGRFVQRAPAHFHVSRDPEGRDIVETIGAKRIRGD